MVKDIITSLLDRVGAPVLITVFIVLLLAETIHGLRRRTYSRTKRLLTNALLSIPGFVVLRLILLPALVWIAIKNEAWRIGLSYLYTWPDWIEGIIAFLLLDYFIYIWHILNHRVSLLWRFHLVHHTDVDLDVSTAIRFHGGELLASVIFRGAAVLLTGASPELVLVYEIAFEAATQFHHSNWRLPFHLEHVLNKIIVTPRMHGIHHSIIRNETDSNYAVIFSFWDRLHRTINLSVGQNEITIGVPVYPDPKELTWWYLLKLPFTAIRSWTKSVPARVEGDKNSLKP